MCKAFFIDIGIQSELHANATAVVTHEFVRDWNMFIMW